MPNSIEQGRALYAHRSKLNDPEYWKNSAYTGLNEIFGVDPTIDLYAEQDDSTQYSGISSDPSNWYGQASSYSSTVYNGTSWQGTLFKNAPSTTFAAQNARVLAEIDGIRSLPIPSEFYRFDSNLDRYIGTLRPMSDQFDNPLQSMYLDPREDLRIPVSLLWQEMAACNSKGEFIYPELFIKVSQIQSGIILWNRMNPDGNGQYIRKDLAYWLVQLYNLTNRTLGEPIDIHVGYRSPDRNVNAKGVTNSYHLTGTAIDIGLSMRDENNIRTNKQKRKREAVATAAHRLGFGGIGMYETFIHLDLGPYHRWAYGEAEKFESPTQVGGNVYGGFSNPSIPPLESNDDPVE